MKRNKSRRWSRSGTLLVYRLVGDTAGALGPRHHIPGRASVAGRQLEGAIGTGEGGARLGRPARVLDSKTNVVQGRWGVSAPTRYYHLILTIARATSRPLHVYFGRRPPAVAWLESCTPHARWYWPSPSLVPRLGFARWLVPCVAAIALQPRGIFGPWNSVLASMAVGVQLHSRHMATATIAATNPRTS